MGADTAPEVHDLLIPSQFILFTKTPTSNVLIVNSVHTQVARGTHEQTVIFTTFDFHLDRTMEVRDVEPDSATQPSRFSHLLNDLWSKRVKGSLLNKERRARRGYTQGQTDTSTPKGTRRMSWISQTKRVRLTTGTFGRPNATI